MLLKVRPQRLANIWASLNEPPRAPASHLVAAQVARIVTEGRAATHQVQDLVHDGGCNLWCESDLHELLDISKQPLFRRPKAKDDGVMGFDYTVAADVALMLIKIERLGFAIDPSPMIEALLPGVRSKAMLTEAEIAVFWFRKERHRFRPVTIETSGLEGPRSCREVRLASGYKAEVIEQGGAVQSVEVTPSRYRRRRMAA